MKTGELYIVAGAALWGAIGVFFNYLSALGLQPLQIVALRVGSAALAFMLYLVFSGRKDLLKIAPRDVVYFIGTGIFSLVFFYWCYFNTIKLASLAVAAVLLYTSPVWIVLLAAVFFHERLSPQKILAVLLTLLGTALIVGVFSDGGARLSPLAALLGLGAGFGYALYSIFGKFALSKYAPETVSAYTFIFATLGAVPLAASYGWTDVYLLPQTWLGTFGIGVVCCLLPFVLYTRGLKQVEAGKAAVLATVEPAVAALFSVALYHEPLGFAKISGMALVFAAILLLNLKLPTKNPLKKTTENLPKI